MISLGCPKALVDSEIVLGKLNLGRCAIVDDIDQSDIVILNTCGFIKEAQEETIEYILKVIELKKEKRIQGIVVMGCLVQRFPVELRKSFKEVDAFIGSGEHEKISEIIEKVISGNKYFNINPPNYLALPNEKRTILTPKHYRYLKISEGCDHRCSFCTIPSFRGKYQSRDIKDIVSEAKTLIKEGAKEIILIGQDTTNFGVDTSKKFLLPELLGELDSLDGVQWIRVLYTYPSRLINDNMTKVMADSQKICHYLDMPLQHINDGILRKMGRSMRKKDIRELLRKFKDAVPDLAIRTSFIVGFPGEGEKEFEELLDFMEEIKFERLGVFKYSKERGTPAERFLGQVPEKIKEERFRRAMELQQKISKKLNGKTVGKKLRILVEENDRKDKNLWIGRSFMDAPEVDGNVFIRSSKLLRVGSFYDVTITGSEAYDLKGEI